MLRLGHSIAKKETLNMLTVYSAGINAFQMQVSNPTSFTASQKFSDASEFKTFISENGVYGVIHGKFTYNFCRKNVAIQISCLIDELTVANSIGVDVIIHQGKNVDHEPHDIVIDRYASMIDYILTQTGSLKNSIVLENSAQQGNEIGFSIDDLAKIYTKILNKSRVKFCIDTCHAYVAGQCQFKTREDTATYLDKFNTLIGLDRVACFHFNDSAVPFNGHNDHHGDICCGYITNPLLGGSPDGLRYLTEIAYARSIPMILETPVEFNIPNQGGITIAIINEWAIGSNIAYLDMLTTYPDLLYSAKVFYAETKKHTKSSESAPINIKCPSPSPLPVVSASEQDCTIKLKFKLKLNRS